MKQMGTGFPAQGMRRSSGLDTGVIKASRLRPYKALKTEPLAWDPRGAQCPDELRPEAKR